MLDVLALALQTDVTRIATLRLGGYYGTFKFLGFPEDPHGVYAHNNGDPQKVAGAKAIDRFYVSQLAYLMGKLRDIEEPGGSVLDNSMIYYGGGLTNGPNLRLQGGKVTYNAHGHHNHPVLLAGRAGGALKTGRHLTFDEGTPQTNLFVNMMELMGMPGERFGDSKEPLSGLV